MNNVNNMVVLKNGRNEITITDKRIKVNDVEVRIPSYVRESTLDITNINDDYIEINGYQYNFLTQEFTKPTILGFFKKIFK